MPGVATSSPILVIGGTFDPVHYGHLRLIENLSNLLPETELRIIPNHQSPLRKQPGATDRQRLTMLQLATEHMRQTRLDSREQQRTGPSYMFDTVNELQHEHPQRRLLLALGSDAFCQLDQWYRWRELVELIGIIVVPRPTQGCQNQVVNDKIAQWQLTPSSSLTQLLSGTSNQVWQLDTPMLDISASQIRELINKNQSVRFLLPDSVIEYIEQQRLYRCRESD